MSHIQNTTYKTVDIGQSKIRIAVDYSPRFGTVYRIEELPGVPPSRIPKDAWSSESALIAEAKKIQLPFLNSTPFQNGVNRARMEIANRLQNIADPNVGKNKEVYSHGWWAVFQREDGKFFVSRNGFIYQVQGNEFSTKDAAIAALIGWLK